MARGKSKKIEEKPILYTIKDKHFGDLEVKNTLNAWWSSREKVELFISAFKFDATVEEACLYAGITIHQYQYFCEIHPTFSDIKDAIKQLPVLSAKKTVAEKIRENYNNAMDYLSRKRKEEFSQKQISEQQGEININNTIPDDLFEKIIKAYADNTRSKKGNNKKGNK
jgi:hypothetical protein